MTHQGRLPRAAHYLGADMRPKYRIESKWNGEVVTITRSADGASVLLQGDEAVAFLNAANETVTFEQEDEVCAAYDDVMVASTVVAV